MLYGELAPFVTQITEDMIVARNKAKVFLVSILDILEPFITPDVKTKLVESVQKLPFKQPLPRTQILRQPKCIVNGEMRDYQLEGLSFLVSMFDNGLRYIPLVVAVSVVCAFFLRKIGFWIQVSLTYVAYCQSYSAILADEMGLGKTLQTIAFLGYLKVMQQT